MFCLAPRSTKPGRNADVAQLVERNLAKVEVAGSNPVVRSERGQQASFLNGGVAERRGNGLQSRVHGFESRLHLESLFTTWAIGAAVARFPDTEEVTGSIPVSPTRITAGQRPLALGEGPLLSSGPKQPTTAALHSADDVVLHAGEARFLT
jgi:hypothetical protein